MKRSDISVIIPTYNRAGMIGVAISSVLQQTMAPAELIIIDDGSCDETENVVNSYIAETRIPIIYEKQENRGPAVARNKGIERASSAFIAFLDSDDYWLKNKLELQRNNMHKNPHYNISHTMERWIRRGKHLNQKKTPASRRIYF